MAAAPEGFLQAGPSAWTFVLFTVLVLGAVSDLRRAKIPNWLTYSAMVGGLLLHTAQSGISGLSQSAGGLVLGIALLLAFYLLGGMGAGDVKFTGSPWVTIMSLPRRISRCFRLNQ